MAEMSVIWLRVAAGLYSLGLLHAILTLVRRREHLFRVALGAFALGSVFHFVSIVEEGIVNHRCPITNFYETLSMCAFLIVVLYLCVHWRYKLESLSVFIFPLVFVAALVATLGNPVSAWSSPVVRNAWLTVHIVLVLLGYAALLLTAVASLVYLFQERELKTKRPRKFLLPAAPAGHAGRSHFQEHGRGLRAHHPGRHRRQYVGLHRIEDRLDQPAQNRRSHSSPGASIWRSSSCEWPRDGAGGKPPS
jgi:ABC-type uncharacterized transport system permease subunit